MARLEEKFRERALGRATAPAVPGAGAASAAPARDTLTELPLRQIEPDPEQPRKDLGDLADLKASIAQVGLVQPIVVAILGYERYRIIAGERRFTAARDLGLERIPAIVRASIEEHRRLELQIIENLHRKDLSPFEEAESYRRLLDEFGLTQEELGRRVGKSQGAISEALRLLTLPDRVRREYRTSDTVSKSLLLEIAKRPEEDQGALWEEAKRGGLTVKKARAQKEKKAPRPQSGGLAPTQEASPAPAPRGMTFRYPIATQDATVTVAFDRPSATLDEIIAALEEALAGEKARQG